MQPLHPENHFPSPYSRPTVPLVMARRISMRDGADIATFVYAQDPAPVLDNADKPPVLMIHGNGEEHGIFGPTIDAAVTAGLDVIAIDARGQGKSTRGTEPLSYELLAADALAVLDALGVKRAHLVGFSDGAIEVLLMARDRPALAASVLAIGANLTPEGVIDDGWDLEGNARINREWNAYWTSGADAVLGGAIDRGLLYNDPAEALVAADLLQLMVDHPHIEASSLGVIPCPTCVMAGENDCIVESETRAIAAAIPGARLVIVPKMGHVLPKHAHADVSRELLINVLLA